MSELLTQTGTMRLTLTSRTRALSMAVVSALIGALLVVAAAVPASADGGLQLTAFASPSILAGNVANVTLTATNGSGADEYNTSFRYVLPAGVAYVAGTTTPGSVGDPQVISNTDAGGIMTQTLVWSNVADLLSQDSTSIGFSVRADQTAYPVGSSFTAQSGVYASADARTVPKFTAAGEPVADATTPVYSATATSSVTRVSALDITKSEPSPETELMRGVHDNPTVYTIVVSNTKEAATDGVVVDDYLPAGLEFLQCGGIDDSRAGTLEYPSAPRLTATTASTDGNCPTPSLVETVSNPTGYPAGVYTHVQWSLGTVAPLSKTTIEYVAAVPMRENTLTFTGGTPATTGAQAANLDNNNGPSTRQDGGAATWTNSVIASGRYSGPVANESDRVSTATDTAIIKASDLSIVKSVESHTFTAGDLNTYSLLVRSSEYVTDHDMTITDVVDDGLCPAFPASVTPTGDPLPSDCQPATVPGLDQDATGGRITAVAYDASSGRFTITILPATDPLARSSSETVSYQVLMRDSYSNGSPTSSGDDLTNRVRIVGTSTSVPGLGVETGDKPVTDDSSTTISTDTTTIDKQILPRTAVSSPSDCQAAGASAYQETAPAAPFQLGDNVCFQLTVNFPSSTQTRNARVGDFVPVGTSYSGYSYGAASTVPEADVTLVTASTRASQAVWSIGRTVAGNTGRYVDRGQTLVLYVMATITSEGSNETKPDLVDNLMKYRQTNSAGKAISLRDSVGYSVASAPPVTLAKSIVSRNGASITPTTSTTTAEGETLGYSLTVANTGTAAAGTNVPVDSVTVWDALPAGVVCADVVTPIPDTGSCSDTAPSGARDPSRSYLQWTIAQPIAAGAASQLTYALTVPSGTSVAEALTNDSSVTRFTSDSTSGTATTFRPANSLDTTPTAAGDGAAPQANAQATATLPSATVAKTGGAVATSATNVAGSTGVQGQGAAYDYSVTVPAGTTAFNAALADADLASGSLPLDASAATYSVTMPDGTIYPAGDTIVYPAGGGTFALSGSASPTPGTLTFPSTFDNAGTTGLTFTVHATGLVIEPGASLAAFTNTARFSSTSTSDSGSTPVAVRTATQTVQVVAPAPLLAKSSNSAIVTASGTVQFSLVASNASSAVAQDVLVVDCLPAGLSLDATQPALPQGVTATAVTAGDLPSGTSCPSGSTRVGYTFSRLVQGQNVTIPLLADVDPQAGGGSTYTNVGLIVTSSLNDGARTRTTEGVQTGTSNSVTETVQGATVTKSVSVNGGSAGTSASGRAGDPATFTVTATLPKNVNFYNAAVFDTLPAGMTIADGSAITCASSDVSITCTPGTTGSQNQTGGTVVFENLGNVTSSGGDRTVKLTIPVILPLGSAAGQQYRNTGTLGWSTASGGAVPTSPTSTFGQKANSNVAAATAQRPALTITKGVSEPSPAPGAAFGYTLTVTNSNAANTSTAYDVQVTDCVPVGIVVTDAGSGTVGPATTNPSCGSTITWTIPSIARNASTQLTYSAVLADATTIDTTPLVNTATVTSYRSLPTGGQTYPAVSNTARVTPSFPKVTISKTAQSGPAYIGTPYTWTVTFTNTGSAGANIDATDMLPAHWKYDAGSSTLTRGGSTASTADPTITGSGTQTLEWSSLGAIPTGTVVLTYTATPTAAAATAPGIGSGVAHTNSVSAVVTDATGKTSSKAGSYSPQTATADAHIDGADLAVVKTGVATKPIAGVAGPQDAWTIAVSNKVGGDQAVGPFTVTDTPAGLPGGAKISGAIGSGWNCVIPSDGTSPFTCTTSAGTTLAPGASLPIITVQVILPSLVASGTVLSNSASVASRTADPVSSDNTGTGTVTTATSADLAIVKTGPGTAQAGAGVSWNLQVQNLGPSDAAGPVTVHDVLPTAVSAITADAGTDWICTTTGRTVDCSLAAGLAVGATPSAITVTGTLASSATGTLSNTASVASSTSDPVASNDTATATSTIGVGTTLSVTKELHGAFTPGSDATYRVSVENTGTADATGVVVRDPMPAGLTYASFAPVDGTWARDASASDPTFDLSGSLEPGATAVIDLTVHVAPDLRGDTVNTAYSAASNAAEQNGRWTNSATPLTALTATKSHAVASVAAGGSLDWTIAVTNQGPSDLQSTDVTTVTDTLPAGVTYVGSTGDGVGAADGWSTAGPDGSGLITWTSSTPAAVGSDLPPITLRVSVDTDYAGSDVANTANADSTNAVQSVTTDRDVVPVTHEAAVTLTKTLDESPVVAGADAHFTITVDNAGPSDARSVSVADLVPSGMTVTAIDSADTGWDCSVSTADCTRASLVPGTSTIRVTARVASSVTSDLSNSARITWSDDTAHTATSTVDVPVRPVADISDTKSAVDADGSVSRTVAAGDVQRWRIVVHNDGPSDAQGPITVTDVLPAGLSFAGLATDTTIVGANVGWTCGDRAGTVLCTSDDTIAAGQDATAPLVISTTVDAGQAAGPLVNSATVTSSTREVTDGTPDTAGTVDVAPLANVAVGLSHSGSGVIGQKVPFTTVVTNRGPSEAQDVTATITLPVGLTFDSTTGTDPLWTAGTPVVNADGTTTVVFTLAGPLGPDATAPPVVVVAAVGPHGYPRATVTAVVATSTTETTKADNTATDPLAVAPLSQIGVTKTHTGTLTRGHDTDYTITVSNTGQTADPGPVMVTDRLPAGLSFVSIDTRGAATCTTGSTVVCTLDGPLAVGASVALKLTVAVAANAPDRIVNSASVVTPTVQVVAPPGGSASASDPGAVRADPDAVGPFAPGGALAFTGSTGTNALLAFALLALLAGAGLLFWRRRRSRRLP